MLATPTGEVIRSTGEAIAPRVNMFGEALSFRQLFCIKIARKLRHSDVICGQPIVGTNSFLAHKVYN